MTNEAISPLRRRMIEDMAIRNIAPKTQNDYVQTGDACNVIAKAATANPK